MKERIVARITYGLANGAAGYFSTGRVEVRRFLQNPPPVGGLTDREAKARFKNFRKTHGKNFKFDFSTLKLDKDK